MARLKIIIIISFTLSPESIYASNKSDSNMSTWAKVTFWGVLTIGVTKLIYLKCFQDDTLSTRYSESDSSVYAYGYLLSQKELAKFNVLSNDSSRWAYIDTFWSKYNLGPFNSHQELKKEFEARIKYANINFNELNRIGWKTDRGRIYIIYGPPAEIDHQPIFDDGVDIQVSQNQKYYEVWYYNRQKGINDIPNEFRHFNDGRMFFVFKEQLSAFEMKQIYCTELAIH